MPTLLPRELEIFEIALLLSVAERMVPSVEASTLNEPY